MFAGGAQGQLVPGPGQIQVATLVGRHAKVRQRPGQHRSSEGRVFDRLRQADRLVEALLRAFVRAETGRDSALPNQGEHEGGGVARLAQGGYPLLHQRPGARGIPLDTEKEAQRHQHQRSLPSHHRRDDVQRALQPGKTLPVVAVRKPEPAQPAGQPHQAVVVASPQQPGQGRPQVGVFELQARQLPLAAGPERRQPAAIRLQQAPVGVGVAHRHLLAALDLQLQGDSANGLEHREADLAIPLLLPHQALVDQRGEAVKRTRPASRRADHLRGLQREPPGKDRNAAEEPLFILRQQGIAPGDRVPDRAMSVRDVARATEREGQPGLDTGQERRGREHPDL
jgi:hypothetical protein